MKHYLLYAFLAGAFLLSGCEKDHDESCGIFRSDYLIVRYVEGDMVLEEASASKHDPIVLYVSWDATKQYLSPDLSDPSRSRHPYAPENTDGFLAIAARNGDVRTDGKYGGAPIAAIYNHYVALADNFASIRLTCDEAWDESHPAGTPLDDLVRIEMSSYYPEEAQPVREYACPLSELPEDALRIIDLDKHFDNIGSGKYCMRLTFDRAVSFAGTRKLTLTLTTADGRTKSASLDLVDPSQRDRRF
ncbi:MAG: hypothetical protein K2H69_05010 [Alistipes sp.]|nr:hypothetical protein [Alistipes sp.]